MTEKKQILFDTLRDCRLAVAVRLMKGSSVLPGRAIALCLLALAALPAVSLAATQPFDQPCAEEAAPPDAFQSPGIGLTAQELASRYGARQIGQGSIFFEYQGVDLHKDGCDLILAFPRAWMADGQNDEFALARALLPADAEYLGAFARGSTIHTQQPAELWHSASLAERFVQMGEDRGGEVLILYTYESSGFEPGPIERVELRTREMPG